jgi:hypothetical protein
MGLVGGFGLLSTSYASSGMADIPKKEYEEWGLTFDKNMITFAYADKRISRYICMRKTFNLPIDP